MIAQEHAPSYQQQHNPTGSKHCPLALPPCASDTGSSSRQRRGEAGAAGVAAGVAGDGWRGGRGGRSGRSQ